MAVKTTKPSNNGPVEDTAVTISRIEAETIRVPVIGTTPLIVHRFSEKAKKAMLDAMQGRKSPKEPKDPASEYLASFYRFDTDEVEPGLLDQELRPNRSGFPVLAFKSATVGGARFYGQLTMTGLRQSLFFRGDPGRDGQMLAGIIGEPQMREDVVRVNRGGTDLRYRAEYRNWTTTLEVVYVKSQLTRNSVISLIDAGGMGVGVGEWRPEKGGDFGSFQVDSSREVEVVS